MLTWTASQQAAMAEATVGLSVLAVVGTTDGAYRYGPELMRWGGQVWDGRLLDTPVLTVDRSGQGFGLATAQAITLRLADPDGFWLRKDREEYVRQPLTVLEVCRDVDSVALRQFAFTITAGRPGNGDFLLDGIDPWGEAMRRPVPNVTVTDSLYPNAPADSQGRTVPVLFGRALTPMVLVDEATEPEARFVACVGTATIVGSGSVMEAFGGTFYHVESFRVQVVERQGMAFTEVLVGSPIRASGTGAVTPHFADLQSYHGSAQVLPDVVLLDLLRRPYLGNLPSVAVSSVSLATARSMFSTTSLVMACAIDAPGTLEQMLADWQFAALTGLSLRDQLYLVPQASVAAVMSFHNGNLVEQTLLPADRPTEQEYSTQVVLYRDATRPVLMFQAYTAGSGAQAETTTMLLGTPGAAQVVAQRWAKRAVAGQRQWEWGALPRMLAVEPGDPVTVQQSHAGLPQPMPMEVVGVTRDASWGVRVTAIPMPPETYVVGAIPTDPGFARWGQKIYPTGQSSQAMTPGVAITMSGSHQMMQQPNEAVVVWQNQQATRLVSSSLTTATGSQWTVRLISTGSLTNVRDQIQYIGLQVL